MKALFFSFVLFLFILPSTAISYIPSADFIISRVTKNSGSGLYQIKQEIAFTNQSQPVTVTETWWIQSDDLMFLKAESALFNFYVLYKNGKKYFFNDQKNLVTASVSQDFYMPLFFKRNSNDLRESLIRRKLAPVQAFKKRPIIKNPKDTQVLANLNEPYLKLDRIKNSISILLGFAALDSSAGGVWIDQDKFLIKKIRFDSESEIVVESYSEISKNLFFPKSYMTVWNNQSAQIELASANSLQQATQYFNEQELVKLSNQVREIPSNFSSVIDFYKRIR